MPPKKRFSKQDIIDSAFEIATIEGINGVTIRKVANQLGSSIAPIYVNFNDVDELKRAVNLKLVEISRQMLDEQDTGNLFLDIGVASLRFANKYKVLFRDLVMNQNNDMDEYDEEMADDLIGQMKKEGSLAGFSDEELTSILFKMKTFTTGLSIMLANEVLSEEAAIELLDRTANDVINGTRDRKGRGRKNHE